MAASRLKAHALAFVQGTLYQWFFVSVPGIAIVSALSGAMGAALALVRGLEWIVAFLGGLAGVLLWLLIATTVYLRRQTVQAAPEPNTPIPPVQSPPRTSQELQEEIQKWLLGAQYTVKQLPKANGLFRIEATMGPEPTCYILEGDDPAKPSVNVLALIPISEPQHKDFDALTGAQVPNLLFELRLALSQLGAEFIGVDHPLRKIQIARFIPVDQLAKFTFLREDMHIVRRGVHVVVTILSRAILQAQHDSNASET